ncbi:protein FAM43B-like [Diadema antillarum]|uniref:protein FAM43B-like n=1 Tax=Diadema antillarum TaxID=105358 RepID=UPI003A8AD539
MFSPKKQSLQITPDDPVFEAIYLGKIEITGAIQPASVVTAVKSLWQRAHDVGPEKLPRVSVALGPHGICMEDKRPKTKYKFQFSIGTIPYCMANKGFSCVFAWVVADPRNRPNTNTNATSSERMHTQDGEIKKPRCHAVVCEREDVARAMALLMTAYFNTAYRDHKDKERRETRKQSTRAQVSDFERRRSSSSFDDDSPSASRLPSRQSSTRSERSLDGENISPIHAMVAKAFGMTPKALSQADADALHATEEKLKSLRMDPRQLKDRGEVEALFNWVSDEDFY